MRPPLKRRGRRARDDDALERSLVWIFGSPRSGSTWLLNLLVAGRRIVPIDEPGIGVHLGLMLPEAAGPQAVGSDVGHLLVRDVRADDASYFFSRRYEDAWRPALRALILERLRAQVAASADGGRDRLVVLKEPNGSQAADMIVSALPRSRMIFLLRDGRDVVDSHMDLLTRGRWVDTGRPEEVERDRMGALEGSARVWLYRTEAVQRAYSALAPERRILVRYEDLLADTPRVLGELLDWLGLEVAAAEVAERVEQLAFDALPAESRGPGRFARAATPGLWREHFSAPERTLVESLLGDKLRELGYATDDAEARRA